MSIITNPAINVIVQNPDNINLIKDLLIPLLGTLFGVIIGGFITYKTSSNLLNKQLSFQNNSIKKNQLQLEIKTLTTVICEMQDNMVLAKKINSIIEDEDSDGINLQGGYFNFHLSFYENAKQEYLHLLDNETISKIQWIYYQSKVFLESEVAIPNIIKDYIITVNYILKTLQAINDDLKKEFDLIN